MTIDPFIADQTQGQGAWLYVDEMSHRALNTYAALLASVERASRRVSDPIAGRALSTVKQRLSAAAAAQRALRPPTEGGMLRLDGELERVCKALSASLPDDRSLALVLSCEPVEVAADRCWRICLAVAELVANASRHAFAQGAEGEIGVELRLVRGHLVCAVTDNGCAAPAPARGGGSKILDALAGELGGVVERRFSSRGSVVVLACPATGEASASTRGFA